MEIAKNDLDRIQHCAPCEKWASDTIGNLFDIRQGKSLARHKQTGRQNKKFLRTANVLWGKLDLSELDEMDFSPAECEALTLKSGDLLVCEGGDIGRTAVWQNEVVGCYYQNHLHRLRARDGRVNPHFVMFWLQAAFTLLRTYEGFGNKTTIPNLSRSRLGEFMIPVPEKTEQDKIAAVLRKIQKTVELEDAIVRSARDLKKSIMRRCFTHGLRGEPLQETEIGSLPESWELRDCESVCSIITVGIVVQPASHYVSKGIPAFRSLNIQEDHFDTSKLVYISPEANDTILSKSKLRTGDVLVVRTGYPGTSCVVTDQFNGANCIDLVILRPNGEMLSEFLSRFFNSESGRQQALNAKTGLAQQHLNVGAVKRTKVPIPPLDEQREIADVLQTVDHKIDIHESKKRSLQELFKTMLHKLMTAQIRVKDLDIDTREVETK